MALDPARGYNPAKAFVYLRVMNLFVDEGLSSAEISDRTGWPLRTVQRLIAEARKWWVDVGRHLLIWRLTPNRYKALLGSAAPAVSSENEAPAWASTSYSVVQDRVLVRKEYP